MIISNDHLQSRPELEQHRQDVVCWPEPHHVQRWRRSLQENLGRAGGRGVRLEQRLVLNVVVVHQLGPVAARLVLVVGGIAGVGLEGPVLALAPESLPL